MNYIDSFFLLTNSKISLITRGIIACYSKFYTEDEDNGEVPIV